MSPPNDNHCQPPFIVDRRAPTDLSELHEQLGELKARVAHIELSLVKLTTISENMDKFITASHGAASVVRVLFYVIGPIVAGGYWLKDHLK